eukprot:9421581-Alexandrium_andersonii.AAC.1
MEPWLAVTQKSLEAEGEVRGILLFLPSWDMVLAVDGVDIEAHEPMGITLSMAATRSAIAPMVCLVSSAKAA